jgi:nitrite reductase/ring-hydroxylating ferredoxin subunit
VTDHDGWVRVGDAPAFRPGRGRRVVVAGAPVAVFWDGDRWLALDDTCPHMGASLSDGRLFGAELQCSWHEWRYDVSTGLCPVRPWARVRVHEVVARDGGVWVRLAPPIPPSSSRPDAEDDDAEWLEWDPGRYFKTPEGTDQGS